MAKKITYLMGAGASADALPVVKYFNERLNRFHLFMKRNIEGTTDANNSFVSQIEEILKESKKHSTIDTVAKKFFHSKLFNPQDLKKLKSVLSSFFIFEQCFDHTYKTESVAKNKHGQIDNRYDSFIASILFPEENQFNFPENLKIITWNYDCQFELALQQFCDESIFEIQNKLKVFPLLSEDTYPDYWKDLSKDIFKILHLNGQAHFYNEVEGNYISCLDKTSQINTKDNLFNSVKYSNLNSMTFSWEKYSVNSLQIPQIQKIINEAKRIMQETDSLVVIGYSFPIFNRKIDIELFESLKSGAKVYLQNIDAIKMADSLSDNFRLGSKNSKVFPVEDISQFFIPPEMNLPEKENYDIGWF